METPAPSPPRPFLLYGDSPMLPSGLGRILRDLAARLVANEIPLNIRVATVGVSETTGLDWATWPHFRFQPTWESQGEGEVARAIEFLRSTGAEGPPILLVIFDPSRSFALLEARDQGHLPKDLEIWGYFPIDGHPYNEIIGGPAGEMIKRVDRCLAYGRYGAQILRKTRGKPISFLPHGVEPWAWMPDAGADDDFLQWLHQQPKNAVVIGVVGTNQPRKDHPSVFEVIKPLEERLRRPVALWVHSDFFTKVWDFGELARIYDCRRGQVFISVAQGDRGESLEDALLAGRYVRSTITIAPGLGEGFGYPILESLLCGKPVVHVNYAGGVELIPQARWLVPPLALRAEGIYGIQRPLMAREDLLEACVEAITDAEDPSTSSLCRTFAEFYSWEHVWPRWEKWIRSGLFPPVKKIEKVGLNAPA